MQLIMTIKNIYSLRVGILTIFKIIFKLYNDEDRDNPRPT